MALEVAELLLGLPTYSALEDFGVFRALTNSRHLVDFLHCEVEAEVLSCLQTTISEQDFTLSP